MSKIFTNNDWDTILEKECSSEYFQKILDYVTIERQNYKVFPPKDSVFRAFQLTSYQNTRVVILGQDPYHEVGQANGLAFSVNKGQKLPRSLKNIYLELSSDIGVTCGDNGDLTSWASQGVLLLNTSLTVRESTANSHSKIGWTRFTDAVISEINKKSTPVIFVLWGNNARAKKSLIDTNRHHIIESAHPSPLSARRGFFGSKPFSKCNSILKSPIDFTIK